MHEAGVSEDDKSMPDVGGYSSDVVTAQPSLMDLDDDEELLADASGGYSSDVDSLPVEPTGVVDPMSSEDDRQTGDADDEWSAAEWFGDDLDKGDWSEEDEPREEEEEDTHTQIERESPVEFGSSDIEYQQDELAHRRARAHADEELCDHDEEEQQLDLDDFDELASSDLELDHPHAHSHLQPELSSDEQDYTTSDDGSDTEPAALSFTQASPPPTFTFSSNPAVRAAQEAAIAAAAAQAQADIEARAARAAAAAHAATRAAHPPQSRASVQQLQVNKRLPEVVDLLDSSDDEASGSDPEDEYDSDRQQDEASVADERGGYVDDNDLTATSESEQDHDEVEDAGAVAGKSIRPSYMVPAHVHVGSDEEQDEYEDEYDPDIYEGEDEDDDGPDPNADQQYLPGYGPSAPQAAIGHHPSPVQSAVAAYWQQQQILQESQQEQHQHHYYEQNPFVHAQEQHYRGGSSSPSPFDTHESSPFAHAPLSHGHEYGQTYAQQQTAEQDQAEYEEEEEYGSFGEEQDDQGDSYDEEEEEEEEDLMDTEQEPPRHVQREVVELLSSSDDEAEREEEADDDDGQRQHGSSPLHPAHHVQPHPHFFITQNVPLHISPPRPAASEPAPSLHDSETAPSSTSRPPRSLSPFRASTYAWPSPPPSKRPRLLFTGSINTSLWSQAPASMGASTSANIAPASGLAPALRHGFGSIGQGLDELGHGPANEEQEQEMQEPEMEVGENGYLGSFVMGLVNRLKRSRASAEMD
ncbi:hypothetical protein BCR44DRAFT_1429327, partial [Catenaria anguillulae PL171]